MSRFAGWDSEYDCKGYWRNSICVLSIEDMPKIIEKPHFLVNKFLLEFDPISYQCMEEWLEERVKKNMDNLNMSYYCLLKLTHYTSPNCLIK